MKVACHILRGGKLNVIGDRVDSFKSFMNSLPVEINNGKSLVGDVIYIDGFGNIITNIKKDLFNQKRGQRDLIYTVGEEGGEEVGEVVEETR